MNNNFVKASIVSPRLKVANPKYNVEEIINILKTLDSDICLFPELSLTSYSCGDLFLNDELRIENDEALKNLLEVNPYKGLLAIGGIFSYNSVLYNVAYIIKGHEILGIVPKYYLPNYQEFSEPRWFVSGMNLKKNKRVQFNGKEIPFGSLIFKCTNSEYNLGIGVEICEDVWAPISPSNLMSLNGANVFLNLSASDDFLYKDKKRESMVAEASRKNRGTYLYSSSGVDESSSGVIFGGHIIGATYGEILVDNSKLSLRNKIENVYIDLGYIDHLRKKDTPYRDSIEEFNKSYEIVNFELEEKSEVASIEAHPFFIKDCDNESLDRIVELESYGIIRKIQELDASHIIACLECEPKSLITLMSLKKAINALHKSPYMVSLYIDERKPLIETIAKEYGFRISKHLTEMSFMNSSTLYINSSDLTDLALGTVDDIPYYNQLLIHSSIPKTMSFSLIKKYEKTLKDEELKRIIKSIIVTSSNKLRYSRDYGNLYIADFILFRFLRRGDSKNRISELLSSAFNLTHEASVRIVARFFELFYSAQSTRNNTPDSLKVTNVSLDSRLDFKVPSDARK